MITRPRPMKKRASRVNRTHAAGRYYRDESVLRGVGSRPIARNVNQQVVRINTDRKDSVSCSLGVQYRVHERERRGTKKARPNERSLTLDEENRWRILCPLRRRWLAGWTMKKLEIRWTVYEGRVAFAHSFIYNVCSMKNSERWGNWTLEQLQVHCRCRENTVWYIYLFTGKSCLFVIRKRLKLNEIQICYLKSFTK